MTDSDPEAIVYRLTEADLEAIRERLHRRADQCDDQHFAAGLIEACEQFDRELVEASATDE